MKLALLPKALLLSTRTAPVRNSRLLNANSCWPKAPNVLLAMSVDVGAARFTDRFGLEVWIRARYLPEPGSEPGKAKSLTTQRLA